MYALQMAQHTNVRSYAPYLGDHLQQLILQQQQVYAQQVYARQQQQQLQ